MDIFANDGRIISDVLNRVINCRELKKIYVYKVYDTVLDFLYPGIEIKRIEEISGVKKGVIYLRIESIDIFSEIIPYMQNENLENDYIIYVPDETISYEMLRKWGIVYPLNAISDLKGALLLRGITFDKKVNISVPDSFRVLAILHFFNEADILEKTITYLLDQGLDIYLIDNWSDDGSYEIAECFYYKFPGRIYLERFPESGRNEYYEWYKQLERTENISKEKEYDWFIHYDTDEMRVSPWKDITLREAIYWIDQSGYNCIENTVIDFKLTNFEDTNIFMKDVFFDFRHKKLFFDQVKTWKRSEQVELKSSGGHFARVENPKMYPLKFLNRHYPLRSLKQAEKKVFCDRLPRFYKEKKERGWHSHYDRYCNNDFLYDSADLLYWDEKSFEKMYISFFLECGLRWDLDLGKTVFHVPNFKNKKILLYGAGKRGREIYLEEAKNNDIVGWVDADYKRIPSIYCQKVLPPTEVENIIFDFLIITIKNKKIQQEILMYLKHIGIADEKIICIE